MLGHLNIHSLLHSPFHWSFLYSYRKWGFLSIWRPPSGYAILHCTLDVCSFSLSSKIHKEHRLWSIISSASTNIIERRGHYGYHGKWSVSQTMVIIFWEKSKYVPDEWMLIRVYMLATLIAFQFWFHDRFLYNRKTLRQCNLMFSKKQHYAVQHICITGM
jgi:hypothetical protein